MIYWKSEARHLTFCGYMTLDTSNWGSKYEVKRSNVKVTGNKNVKNRFSHISSWKLDWFTSNRNQNDHRSYSTHIIEYISPAKCVILRYLSVCLSVTSSSLTQNWNDVESSYFMARHFLYFCIFMQLSFKYRKNFTHYATATKLCIRRSHRHTHYRTMEQGIYHIAMSMFHFALFLPRDAL